MKTNNKLRVQAYFLLGFLSLQYLLGMLTNLFVAFPENNTDLQQWEFAKTQFMLMAHIILGILLLVGAIMLYIRAFQAKDRHWKIASGIGLGSILLAILSGSEFISTQSEYYSLVMSLLFILAVGAFGWGIYQSNDSK